MLPYQVVDGLYYKPETSSNFASFRRLCLISDISFNTFGTITMQSTSKQMTEVFRDKHKGYKLFSLKLLFYAINCDDLKRSFS